MARGHLIVTSGEAYDERLQLFDEFGRVLFDGCGDALVTSVHGMLEWKLNMSVRSQFDPFRILRSGKDALFVPSAVSPPDGEHCCSPVVIDWAVVEQVWRTLRYPEQELENVPEASTTDFVEAWITGAHYRRRPAEPLHDMLVDLAGSVLAEDPEVIPSVIDVITACAKDQISCVPPISRRTSNESEVTAYLNGESRIHEWKALVATEPAQMTLGDRWMVAFAFQDGPAPPSLTSAAVR